MPPKTDPDSRTGAYWYSIAPLAALFDWMRKMFERGKDIREAKKAEIRAKERRKGREQGLAMGRTEGYAEGLAEGIELGRAQIRAEENERIRALLAASGLSLPPEIAAAMFGDAAKNGS